MFANYLLIVTVVCIAGLFFWKEWHTTKLVQMKLDDYYDYIIGRKIVFQLCMFTI